MTATAATRRDTMTLSEAAGRGWDAVVVGAGPAGSAVAHGLARLGHDVLILDRAAFPRDKVCGGCLSATGLRTLARLGLTPPETHVPRRRPGHLVLRAGDAVATLPLRGGVVVARSDLDDFLLRTAIDAGASFVTATAGRAPDAGTAGDEPPDHRIIPARSRGVMHAVRTRLLVWAAGLGAAATDTGDRVTTRSRIGLAALVPAGVPRAPVNGVDMHCGQGGYLGLVELPDGRLNAAAAFDPRWVRRCGGPAAAAAAVLEACGVPPRPELAAARWQGTPALTRHARRVAACRLLIVGDAAGYEEPFTGEGMGWALAAAHEVIPLAAAAIDGWSPRIAAAWRQATRRRHARTRRCRIAAWLLRHPAALRVTLRAIAAGPVLARPILDGWCGGPAAETTS
ncbi:MAG: NAD(P)-binding protein [Phycisphaerales bacterium]|nr:NAD(P)-binding protein [Phycisphaerales bacterium]